MLGFMRGIEKGVAREGAAQRAHYGQVLQGKENHLDRLLAQIKYNQQLKRQDRAYDRGVLESDRNYALRQNADTRAEEAHDFLYDPKTGLMPIRAKREGEIHDFNYGEGGYMRQRAKREGEVHDFNYGEGGLMPMRRQIVQNELDEYAANEQVRNLTRRYNEKLGEYNLGEGWKEYLEDKSLSQDLTRAQINNLNRPRSTSSSRSGPTWTQTRDITIENLAPPVLKYLRDEGEHWKAPFTKGHQWQWGSLIPPFIWPESDRPFVSEDPNEVTQTKLLRQAGGHLVEELINRGVDPEMVLTMIPDYWDQILDAKGSDVLKRLKRTSQAEGYDELELRKILRDEVYRGAMNYLQTGHYDRSSKTGTSAGADKLLDTPIQ